jgi:hypothetical protein
MNYKEIYQYHINEKEKFWVEQARNLKWFKETSDVSLQKKCFLQIQIVE